MQAHALIRPPTLGKVVQSLLWVMVLLFQLHTTVNQKTSEKTITCNRLRTGYYTIDHLLLANNNHKHHQYYHHGRHRWGAHQSSMKSIQWNKYQVQIHCGVIQQLMLWALLTEVSLQFSKRLYEAEEVVKIHRSKIWFDWLR